MIKNETEELSVLCGMNAWDLLKSPLLSVPFFSQMDVRNVPLLPPHTACLHQRDTVRENQRMSMRNLCLEFL